MKKISKYFIHPEYLMLGLSRYQLLNWISDETFLKIVYKLIFKRKIDLKNPQTYSEKLQWIKLYDRNPLYTELVDKKEVKKHVASIIGEEYIISTIGVWNSADEIDFDSLPNQFVLKCNHDSGGLVICRNKKDFDCNQAIRKLNKCLKYNGYWYAREWPYKNVKPCIIAEPYIEDPITHELSDYKFFSFNGKVKAMFIATDRYNVGEDTKFDFYDENFEHLDFTQGHPNSKKTLQKPIDFEKMRMLAEKLSEGLPHARIDFYNVQGEIYFGEITFFHFSGLEPFKPENWDYKFGELLDLPR